jgi:hypothetical protein
LRLELADTLYVIGFPLGFDPQKAPGVLGVWCRGSIAWPPSIEFEELPCLLLDCRARPGQSGSPVIAYADRSTRYLTEEGNLFLGPKWELVGIYSGRLRDDSDVGRVWKRAVLDDLVERGVRPMRPHVSEMTVPLDALTPEA